MITNINCIKGVGKFENCNPRNITLKNNVIVFGNNTNGKSTLTSIFSSLKYNNNDFIIGRRTFGHRGNQNVVIKIDGNNHIFNTSWNNQYPNLEIFDTKFISDNVCNTEDISFEQQKRLNGVILGEEGNSIHKNIHELTKQITDFSNKKSEITRNYFTPLLNGVMSLNDFSTLEEDIEVDDKISLKEKELEQIENKVKVLGKIQNSFFRYEFKKIEETLSDEINIDFNIIQQHIDNNISDESKGKRFLQEGLEISKSDNCPFCGETYTDTAKQLLEQYKQVFTTEFSSIQKKVFDTVNSFEILDFKDKIEKEKLEFEKFGLNIPLDDDKITQIVTAKTNSSTKFQDKKSDLTININFEEFDDWKFLKDEFEKVIIFLDNEKAKLLTEQNVLELQNDLKKLKLTKQRFEQDTVDKIAEYNSFTREIETLQTQRNTKNTELETYATDVFHKYQEKINYYLSQLNANFELDDFSHLKRLRGNDEFVFTIKFNSHHKINIYDCEHCRPNFKNTLSESDKRTLAFSFFLSRLVLDDNLDNKIVIFDDPISSFDRERKRKTIDFLLNINSNGKFPKQIIILTHQDDFLKTLNRKSELLGKDSSLLKIVQGDIKLIENLDREFPDDEIYNLLENLKEKYDNQEYEWDFHKDCRKILENVLKKKYYVQLKPVITRNPRASIRTFCDTVYQLGSAKHNKLILLCNDLQVPLHDNGTPEASAGDNQSIIRDFFDVLEEL